MLFQSDLYILAITLVLSATIATSLILFLAGIYMMQRYAKSKNWDESYILALKINLIWLASSLVIGILISLFAGDTVIIDFLRIGINVVVGIIMVNKLYKKTTEESISFVLALQVILFILAIIVGNIFNGINLLIMAS